MSYYPNKKFPDRPGYVRHHAANLRFERLGMNGSSLLIHRFPLRATGLSRIPSPGALLAGKKRLERNAAVRGQVIMWQSLFADSSAPKNDLFKETAASDHLIRFESLPLAELAQAVPEDTWNRTDPRAKEMEAAYLFEEGLHA